MQTGPNWRYSGDNNRPEVKYLKTQDDTMVSDREKLGFFNSDGIMTRSAEQSAES